MYSGFSEKRVETFKTKLFHLHSLLQWCTGTYNTNYWMQLQCHANKSEKLEEHRVSAGRITLCHTEIITLIAVLSM